MAVVLTLGQEQFSVLHYHVHQGSVALSSSNFEECDNPILGSALKQAKKDVNTLELAQLIQYEKDNVIMLYLISPQKNSMNFQT